MIINQHITTCDENCHGLASCHDRPTMPKRLLPGRPVRHLSQILIVILMLISPLSFSTDKIPNFAYECPVSSGSAIKPVAVAAISDHVASPPEPKTIVSIQPHVVPATITPCIELIGSASPSRAPPC